MPLIRNNWYEVGTSESGTIYGRWRDATVDYPDKFCYEQSYSNKMPTNDLIFLYEEYENESDAITRLENAINAGV